MKKTTKILTVILGVLLVTGILLHGLLHWDYESKPDVFNMLGLNPAVRWKGKLAPNFQLRELHTGKLISLQQYRGKVVILDFWASWCPGCRKQLKVLQRIHRDKKIATKVRILSINMKETAPPKAVREFLRVRDLTFPVLLATKKVVQDYKIWFFPAMVIISPTGQVVYSGAEFHTESKIRNILATITKR